MYGDFGWLGSGLVGEVEGEEEGRQMELESQDLNLKNEGDYHRTGYRLHRYLVTLKALFPRHLRAQPNQGQYEGEEKHRI